MTPDRIRSFRDERGITQAALAALLGVRDATVSDWERGVKTPPAYLGLALAAIRDGVEPVA
jgi:DNA-binding transcriptional regulator YiaG